MILQGVSFTCRPGSILVDDLHSSRICGLFGALPFQVSFTANLFYKESVHYSLLNFIKHS